MTFTQAELDYLASQMLGRLATVAPGGQVQNNPVGFAVDPAAGTVLVGGHDLAASKKFKNVVAGSTVALVVDDLASVNPWSPRMLEIRGTAEALPDAEPLRPGFGKAQIRITPHKIISFGLGAPPSNRTV
ncbi:MAG: PPOX class F420-dependent oxidoreductase [Nonomuraea sp.]|nr:PPOX class F420-dependent oxidoreductase [Nonomuraea sp.]